MGDASAHRGPRRPTPPTLINVTREPVVHFPLHGGRLCPAVPPDATPGRLLTGSDMLGMLLPVGLSVSLGVLGILLVPLLAGAPDTDDETKLTGRGACRSRRRARR